MKKITCLIFTAALCLMLSACSESSEAPDYSPSESMGQTRLSESEAKVIALGHAGLTEDSVTFTGIKLDRDNGVYEYELEFITSTAEYEYEIGMDGAVLAYSSKLLSVSAPPTVSENTETTAAYSSHETEASVPEYTETTAATESAKTEAAPVTSNYAETGTAPVTSNYAETGTTPAVQDYAETSTVPDTRETAAASIPVNTETDPAQYSRAVISEQEAKIAALNNAGFNEAQVIFTEIKLDCDDDCPYHSGHHGHHNGGGHCHGAGCHYEIEFVAGNVEYDYEIGVYGELLEYGTENISR